MRKRFMNSIFLQCGYFMEKNDNLIPFTAALTEPLSCLTHGWDIISPIPVGSKILIIGAGIIGNLWVAVLHLHGHRRVTVSEPNVARLNTIKKLSKFNTTFRFTDSITTVSVLFLQP